MTSTALSAQGTKIGYALTAAATAYTQIVNVTEVSGFDGTATEIDVTNLSSTAKEKRLGLQDWGTVSLAMDINLREASHAALLAAKKAGSTLYFQVVLSDGTTASFAAFVKSFPISAAVDGVYKGTIALTVTGDITFVVATS